MKLAVAALACGTLFADGKMLPDSELATYYRTLSMAQSINAQFQQSLTSRQKGLLEALDGQRELIKLEQSKMAAWCKEQGMQLTGLAQDDPKCEEIGKQ